MAISKKIKAKMILADETTNSLARKFGKSTTWIGWVLAGERESKSALELKDKILKYLEDKRGE